MGENAGIVLLSQKISANTLSRGKSYQGNIVGDFFGPATSRQLCNFISGEGELNNREGFGAHVGSIVGKESVSGLVDTNRA